MEFKLERDRYGLTLIKIKVHREKIKKKFKLVWY